MPKSENSRNSVKNAQGRRSTSGSESKERLIVAASTVFGGLGYDRATIDDIAEEAGISRGSVFWHFGSKEVLLRAVIDRTLGRLQSMGLEQVTTPRGLAALGDGLEAHRARAHRDPELRRLFHVLIGQAHGPQSEIAPAIIEMRRQSRSLLANWLRQAMEDGEVKRDVDVDGWVTVVLAAMSGLVGHWLLEPEEIDFDRCYDELRHMIFASIRCGAG
jgi:TetR/AcrR family acrAB operon transcriptional repressor